MQGLEVVLLRLAGTAVGAIARSAVAPRKGAGLVPSPLRPVPRPTKPDRLAKVLGGRLAERYGALPEHERLAAIEGVRDAFAAAGPIDTDRLFAAGLDPARLRDALRSPDRGLSGRTLELYDDLLGLCCAHLVEQLTAEPSFPARAAVEQVRTADRTRDAVESLIAERPRPEAAALAFEERYARYVAQTHGRLELFGLTLGRSAREWPLDTAYITLAVSGGHEAVHGLSRTGPATVSTEVALTTTDRLLLHGPAGSGKSTLVQWLALNAARRSFEGDLADWNRCVPFVLRLRAFTSADALPLPEDFLRATGVPLSPPAGWAEDLLTRGRALVLVDGVDEVPVRLRQRTETWLRGLVTAFPQARYVVTTRPSAVPESWLSRQGFAPHTLLPMDRNGIRAFVAHWHEAARLEAPEDDADLTTYESALRQAVGTRRDLGRLATNPLMCALLCALNRDRRMQLPRARKELYDAALDMLLVRRDTEREICGVEGVGLTRDEQTALLQRLAYWLIRNGQVEADRDEAEEMVGEWLAAMPQVRGTREQVFAHLLIRSGLLREPAPGSVGFVHRTFQDYLGAKAAVEARDFGVLVKNAHDDTWDDVVQMAVGHARLEERGRLLKQLLRRAERAPRLRGRLVLLAAACLEHAPELEPGVRAEVERRARELIPPRSVKDAEDLAKAGELVLELLPGPEDLDADGAAAVVRTAALVTGDAAFEVVARFREDDRFNTAFQRSEAWGAFDTERYAREVLAASTWDEVALGVQSREQLAALRLLPRTRSVRLNDLDVDLTALHVLHDLRRVFLYDNASLADLSPLRRFAELKDVGLGRCPALKDLSPLARPGLETLSVLELHHELSVEPLRDMPDLSYFSLGVPLLMERLEELPIGPSLTSLALGAQARYVDLSGIERWPLLATLSLQGRTQTDQLLALRTPPRLTTVQLLGITVPDFASLGVLEGLRALYLARCEVPDLTPLRDLPTLDVLHLWQCTGPGGRPIDVSPLASLSGLRVSVNADTELLGEELLDPDRVIRSP
ncbi:NACHT domain-containing protein [Streptomyces sp. SP18ES09]|uniref:NACHT domain-containing protein n=1 Tax=Streptomyces sp. SP18ES09 TaxID=3002532 RepID=UPI002E774C7C|nr:NACHT domain-containing protein [Streptomyces sp. SP18ES09]MEE1818957.1 NACHT domain-containing protein [Streptomyces sp. SP18ES09]